MPTLLNVTSEFGDVDVLKYEDIETPAPKPGHKQEKKMKTIVKGKFLLTAYDASIN